MDNMKQRILTSFSSVIYLEDYELSDCIFSMKYGISPANMTYILLRLSQDFNFKITNDFVESLEMCTFAKLEALLKKYENTQNSNN